MISSKLNKAIIYFIKKNKKKKILIHIKTYKRKINFLKSSISQFYQILQLFGYSNGPLLRNYIDPMRNYRLN